MTFARLKEEIVLIVAGMFVASIAAFLTGCMDAMRTDSLEVGMRTSMLLFGLGCVPVLRIGASLGGLYTLSMFLVVLYHGFQKALIRQSIWNPFLTIPFSLVAAVALFAGVLWLCIILGEIGRLVDWLTPSSSKKQSDEEIQNEMQEEIVAEASVPECFTILGVNSSAAVDEIKRAYREQVKLYHPDRVACLGEELQELATRKTRELRTAQEEALSLVSSAH